MTQPDFLAQSVLSALDIVVLRRVSAGEYELFGRQPDFYLRLFPPVAGKPCAEPWRSSQALHAFFENAETFFSGNTSGFLPSGVWMEGGGQKGLVPLTATAMCLEGEQIIALRRLSHEVVEKQRANAGLPDEAASTAEAEVETPMPTDELTSLYSREAFLTTLEREVALTRTGRDLSVLFIDVDDLKAINTMYGSEVGDSVLTALGGLLHNLLRRDDISARYKGGTFAVLAPFTIGYQVLRMAEKLRGAIAEHSFASLPPLTVCVGCTTYRKGETGESFLARAEQALNEAKSSGKNMVRVR